MLPSQCRYLAPPSPRLPFPRTPAVGPREGPVSAPAWPFVRTLVDELQAHVLISAGNFVYRHLVMRRVEQNDVC